MSTVIVSPDQSGVLCPMNEVQRRLDTLTGSLHGCSAQGLGRFSVSVLKLTDIACASAELFDSRRPLCPTAEDWIVKRQTTLVQLSKVGDEGRLTTESFPDLDRNAQAHWFRRHRPGMIKYHGNGSGAKSKFCDLSTIRGGTQACAGGFSEAWQS
jgi:hypothetical protein